ncbi:MAG: methyltransferase domain-containing protein [Rhizobiales bacterium]|nr:methyltransferase domain-containing protein [Hyphomicrobiales bacterium]MBO6699694.1 methyltransferase domain-containing protein [Hyphomicrobiales bacterium]MBO6737232.1 methyltransferase domain-containing protein [Hyphomicrobiales bacterium]MBO6911694.1 methyltransferase domain-containing protein [Hyphomicrobiales bacterium]MBO6954884.1 methyltransferase domain-containing protein [Hyphomicrobiales bacterium]
MQVDIIDLRDFYTSPLGLRTRGFLRVALRRHLPDAKGLDVAGIGFSNPYLGQFRGEAERLMSFMPGVQGCVNWPSSGPNASVLVDEDALPLANATLDRVFLIHALEFSPHPRQLMEEVWRVLAPGGRMIAVVPNRRGLLARVDSTPFGHGRPFSKGQMIRLCRDTQFSPTAWSEALHFFPFQNRLALRTASFFERMGKSVVSPLGGVIILEATKHMFRGLPVTEGAKVRAKPVLVPVGAVPN